MRAGDTLGAIAAGLWGDAGLWWKLAEANGLSGQGGLVVGQRLTIPAGVMRATQSASTFNPYDPADAMGATSPGGGPRPVPSKQGGCGVIGTVIVLFISYVVQLVLDYYLPSAGTAVGNIIRGAFIGATSNAAGQYVGVQTGIQEKFSWNAVAMAGVSGGVEGGFASGGALSGKTGWQPIARAAIANATAQGAALTHQWQNKFDWAGVAASAAIGGVSSYYHPTGVLAEPKMFGAKVIAGAAARGLINGDDFGDNVRAVLPGVVASTIGESLSKELNKARLEQHPEEGYKRFIRAAYDHYRDEGSFLGWQVSQTAPPPDYGDTVRKTNSGWDHFFYLKSGTGDYSDVPYLLRNEQWDKIPSVFDRDTARVFLRLYESGEPSIVIRSDNYEEQFAPFEFGIWSPGYGTTVANSIEFSDFNFSPAALGLGLISGANNFEVPPLPKIPVQLPRNGGNWTGIPGESGWLSNNPKVTAITGGAPVQFKGGWVDFSPWSRGFLKIQGLTGDSFLDRESGLNALADKLSRMVAPGEVVDANGWLKSRALSLHHAIDGTGFQMIPRDLHDYVHHTGGAAVLRSPGYNPAAISGFKNLVVAAKYGGRALTIVGAAADAWTVGSELATSVRTGYYGNTSIAAAGVAGGWGAAAVGAGWGARMGLAFGPWGALAGGIVGGALGYWAGSTGGKAGMRYVLDQFTVH